MTHRILSACALSSIIFAGYLCGPNALGEKPPHKENSADFIANYLLDSYIIEELSAKDITVDEICDTLTSKIATHLKKLKIDDLGFTGIRTPPGPVGIKDEKVFIHVKNVSLKTILLVICDQTNSRYLIKDGAIIIAHPDTD